MGYTITYIPTLKGAYTMENKKAGLVILNENMTFLTPENNELWEEVILVKAGAYELTAECYNEYNVEELRVTFKGTVISTKKNLNNENVDPNIGKSVFHTLRFKPSLVSQRIIEDTQLSDVRFQLNSGIIPQRYKTINYDGLTKYEYALFLIEYEVGQCVVEEHDNCFYMIMQESETLRSRSSILPKHAGPIKRNY